VNAAQIGVAVKDGVVTLNGRVDSYWEKIAAERAAARVEGVRAWQTNWRYTCPFSSERTDEDIARAAVIDWSGPFPCQETGSRSRYPRDGSRWKAWWIGNFKKQRPKKRCAILLALRVFLNHIEVKPQVSSTEVKSAIEAALKRSVEVDAKRITVETEGDKVILRGTVRSWFEREEAERLPGGLQEFAGSTTESPSERQRRQRLDAVDHLRSDLISRLK